MKSVLVLGGTGMLGSMVTDELARSPQVRLSATYRSADRAPNPARLPGVHWNPFDANAGRIAGSTRCVRRERMDHQCNRDYEAANPGRRSPADRDSDSRQCAAAPHLSRVRPRRWRTRSSNRDRLCILRRQGRIRGNRSTRRARCLRKDQEPGRVSRAKRTSFAVFDHRSGAEGLQVPDRMVPHPTDGCAGERVSESPMEWRHHSPVRAHL